jgi:itaconate CoA-transferase
MRLVSYSKRGRSIIASYSTAAKGKCSRIVPRLQGPGTDPRMDVQSIATEYGLCDLRGKTSTERALGLIEIAHPSFRTELLAAAKEWA